MAEQGRGWLQTVALLGAMWVALPSAQAVTVLDDRQQKVQIDQAPQRIVSLLPSLTETVCALKLCHKLVGLDRYSNWPEAVQSVPRTRTSRASWRSNPIWSWQLAPPEAQTACRPWA